MRWQIGSKLKKTSKKERREEIFQALLGLRGISSSGEKSFFNPPKPEALSLKAVGLSEVQMKKAVKRLMKAVKEKEEVVVYGDYDVDGICATAIVWEALYSLGVKAMPFIPQRDEGYGLKVDRLDQFVKEGVSLVVTVDQGIVHSRQAEHARKQKLDLIITDHHLPSKKKPLALAVVHTTKLAGCGVAWFLVRELLKASKGKLSPTSFLDLAALGTVADMVPLLGGSRSLVKYGLLELAKTTRPGLQALFELASLDKEHLDTDSIGFFIGPRLNAAGRMGDPLDALRLFCTKDRGKGRELARKLDSHNRERQRLTESSFLLAKSSWLEEDGKSALIFVYHETFQEGLIGLIASKLKEEFSRPAVVVAQRGKVSKGSARSIDGFNISQAIETFSKLLDSHGGHPGAAGFSLPTTALVDFKEKLVAWVEESLPDEKKELFLKVDLELVVEDFDLELVKSLERLAPFGMGNPRPTFVLEDLNVGRLRVVGRSGRHLQVGLEPGGLKAIGFGFSELAGELQIGGPVAVAFKPMINHWRGQEQLSLRLEDIKMRQAQKTKE